jgi:hypothetical protein
LQIPKGQEGKQEMENNNGLLFDKLFGKSHKKFHAVLDNPK